MTAYLQSINIFSYSITRNILSTGDATMSIKLLKTKICSECLKPQLLKDFLWIYCQVDFDKKKKKKEHESVPNFGGIKTFQFCLPVEETVLKRKKNAVNQCSSRWERQLQLFLSRQYIRRKSYMKQFHLFVSIWIQRKLNLTARHGEVLLKNVAGEAVLRKPPARFSWSPPNDDCPSRCSVAPAERVWDYSA